MPATDELIQRAIHSAEEGKHAVWLRRAVILVVGLGLAVFHLLYGFFGLATSQAMDQAQIGREIARGNGWSTQMARPLAVGELQSRHKDVPRAIWHDTYHAPLPPLLNAAALLLVKDHWGTGDNETIYQDRTIAIMAVIFFFASVGVLYLIAARLFDHTLAWLACGLVLICDAMWQYALSGLPQMLLLFLLNCTVYALIRALEARAAGGSSWVWLTAASIGFGLLALSHALTLWIFVPALIGCALCFRPAWRTIALMGGVMLVMYGPWLVRNYQVCGNPFGLGIYAALHGVGHTEAGFMRRTKLDDEAIQPVIFRGKIRNNVVAQFNRIFEHLGWSPVALAAAISLLHPFRRRETATLRWLLLAMWLGAVLGMALFWVPEEQGVAASQLHLIFVPLLTCYGLAFLFVQWNRLGIHTRFLRAAFVGLLFVICGLPTILSVLLTRAPWPIHWPPYIPSFVGSLSDWARRDEIIASDMPWAVAWYADRKSVWVPDTIKDFAHLHDFRVLGAPINFLYLTPVSGSENRLGDLLTGEYRDWAPLIARTSLPPDFPLKWSIRYGVNECVLFCDRDRRISEPK